MTRPRLKKIMNSQCPFESRLGAFHDGELDEVARRCVEEHLPTCPACQGLLARLQSLSQVVGSIESLDPTAQEMERIHQAATQGPRWDDLGSNLRIGAFLLATAASVLIICSAWLVEFPASAPNRVPLTSHQPMEWELVAVNLRAEPRPDDRGQPRLAGDARIINWMVESLQSRESFPRP
jgi:hypothetical protein